MAGQTKRRQQELAISGLLERPTIAEAATFAGIGEATIYRWLRSDTAFQEAYRQARRAVLHHATTRLQKVCAKAVDTLEAVLTDSSSPAPARVTAAKAILELAYRAVELEDLDERISRLEALA